MTVITFGKVAVSIFYTVFFLLFLFNSYSFFTFLLEKLNQVELSGWMGRDWFSHREH